MTASTDAAPPIPGKIIGRTKYDLLAGSGWMFIVVLIIIFIGYVIWSGSLSGLSVDPEALKELGYYFLPFFLGCYIGYFVYTRYMLFGVVVAVEGPIVSSYIISRDRFNRLPLSTTLVCPEPTSSGMPLYRCRRLDLTKNEVDWGWQHLSSENISRVLTFKEDYDSLMENYRDSEIERNRLKNYMRAIVMAESRKDVAGFLKVIEYIQRGTEIPPVEELFPDIKSAGAIDELGRFDVLNYKAVKL